MCIVPPSGESNKGVTPIGIEYSINEVEKTATITGYQGNNLEVIIPTSIKHKSKEYIVTSISNGAFYHSKIKSIIFEPNSELQTIEKNAFTYSNLSSIKIPASTVELKDGWCYETNHLNHVEVESGNVRYSSIDGKCIIGKSDISKEDYDTLIFWTRDSMEAKIPGSIKIIGKHAFSQSKLTNIVIPSHVTQICEYAFYECGQLNHVGFEPNSELRTIEENAFIFSSLSSLKIPASTVELKDGWCNEIKNLNHVEVESGNVRYSSIDGKCIIGKSDISKENYDTLIFWTRDSMEAKIPGSIKIIGKHSFSYSKLASIVIPSHVTQICEYAFYRCEHLSQVEFGTNSELQTIEKYAFSESKLSSIAIPAHCTIISEGAFSSCGRLLKVKFEPNSELQTIGKYAFSGSHLSSIVIPANCTIISEGAFHECKQFIKVEFEPNSKLQTIDRFAFANSKLLSIVIPAHVTKVDLFAFDECEQLKIVEIDENSINVPSIRRASGYSKIIMLPVQNKIH